MIEADTGWRAFVVRTNPGAIELPAASRTFHIFNKSTGEAIIAIILDTLCEIYKQSPESIYQHLELYVDSAARYDEARTEFDVDPAEIKTRTIHLAIPELTWPKQWPHLFRAILYGKEKNVALRISRIRG
jgi:hypothetical protein